MKLYLVRHGRTHWNKIQRIQGSIDQPLDEEGISQAHRLGFDLQGISFDRIYSSPLQRAHETALIINQYLKKEVILEHELRESSFGAAEGLARHEYRQFYEERRLAAHSMPQEMRFQYRVVPDAENVADVVARVLPFLHSLSSNEQGKTLLAVSHGGVIRSLLASLFGMDDRIISIENAGFIVLEGLNGKFVLQESQGIQC